eukprot:TRINITY_DN8514_c0_g2_i1.p1 TRINITY_DN8514_c0_g2~~TRINITY_DN8514_c0_g2_i1.p1  ORF type:complete len:116 (-),score=12.59 TRINITY_DN8514_c0_g2_i1:384-731(-)
MSTAREKIRRRRRRKEINHPTPRATQQFISQFVGNVLFGHTLRIPTPPSKELRACGRSSKKKGERKKKEKDAFFSNDATESLNQNVNPFSHQCHLINTNTNKSDSGLVFEQCTRK